MKAARPWRARPRRMPLRLGARGRGRGPGPPPRRGRDPGGRGPLPGGAGFALADRVPAEPLLDAAADRLQALTAVELQRSADVVLGAAGRGPALAVVLEEEAAGEA